MQFQRLLLLFVASDSGNRYWDWTLPCIRAQIELSSTFVYDYKMSMSSSPAKNSHLTEGERTTMKSMPVNRIISRCKLKLSQKYCPWINFQLRNFCHSFLQWMGSFFLIIMFCSAIHVYTDRFSFVPPGWGANSSQSCRSYSFSSHKQRCWTVLSQLQYKVAYNPNTFSLNWKQRTAGRAVEDALQYIKMYVAGVWTKTAKEYFKMSRNKSFDVRARFGAIYSPSKTKKYLSKNSTIGNRLLF